MPSDAHAVSLVHPVSRREWIRLGGLGVLGAGLRGLAATAPTGPAAGAGVQGTGASSFGRAKGCLVVFLTGGPPQHETFDPKPDAPVEIRGPFGSIPTAVPGLRFSELLPRTARIADRLTVIRSMTTDINSHSSSGHFMLTGHPHPAGQAETPASVDDWPSLAALVNALKPSERSPFSAAVLPEPIVNNPGVPWPGQNAGLLGAVHHPQLFRCDPTAEQLEVEGLRFVEGLTAPRIRARQALLRTLDLPFVEGRQSDPVHGLDRVQRQAFQVLQSQATLDAFALEKESSRNRDRYGRNKFGQSLLLARRLLEAGVRLVQVNWPREPGDLSIGNPLWDTHSKNADRCRSVLCPTFDTGFPELVRDLEASGLLDETLVVVMGEFGRSPAINPDGGRDHWGACFSIALAGAGTGGGRVLGASDRLGGYVHDRPVRPSELAATILHLLGIRPSTEYLDVFGRPRTVTDAGVPLPELTG